MEYNDSYLNASMRQSGQFSNDGDKLICKSKYASIDSKRHNTSAR